MDEERIRKALMYYDGDACRPEMNIDPVELAYFVAKIHLDIAACYCPTCVLARTVLTADRKFTEIRKVCYS